MVVSNFGSLRCGLAIAMLVGGPLFIQMPGCTAETDRNAIRVEAGFIGDGRFAFAESKSSGYKLFIGSVDGDATLLIHSSGRLQTPYIVDSSRLLVEEQIVPTKPGFRLLEIKIDGSNISCRRLVESQRLIAHSPIVLNDAGSESILFFSGEYDTEAEGVSVHNFRLTRLRDGKLTILLGDSFLTIGRLSQVSENRFVSVSPMIWKEANDARALRWRRDRRSGG